MDEHESVRRQPDTKEVEALNDADQSELVDMNLQSLVPDPAGSDAASQRVLPTPSQGASVVCSKQSEATDQGNVLPVDVGPGLRQGVKVTTSNKSKNRPRKKRKVCTGQDRGAKALSITPAPSHTEGIATGGGLVPVAGAQASRSPPMAYASWYSFGDGTCNPREVLPCPQGMQSDTLSEDSDSESAGTVTAEDSATTSTPVTSVTPFAGPVYNAVQGRPRKQIEQLIEVCILLVDGLYSHQNLNGTLTTRREDARMFVLYAPPGLLLADTADLETIRDLVRDRDKSVVSNNWIHDLHRHGRRPRMLSSCNVAVQGRGRLQVRAPIERSGRGLLPRPLSPLLEPMYPHKATVVNTCLIDICKCLVNSVDPASTPLNWFSRSFFRRLGREQ